MIPLDQPPETFTCVDCGGTANMISHLPIDEAIEPGTPIAYRCSDCMERFDVFWEPGD